MPRKSAAKKEEPSSDEASAHSDVEMQDQQDDTMNGFKKFGVSVTPRLRLPRRDTYMSCGRKARQREDID